MTSSTGVPGNLPEPGPAGHTGGAGRAGRTDDEAATDEAATVGGAALPPPAALHRERLPAVDGTGNPRSPARCAGPVEDPDRYELLGEGVVGGEGVLWRAHYRGWLPAPITVAVKMLRPPPGAELGWPTPADRRRWQDQAALLRHLDLDHMVRLHEVFAGAPPHRPGETEDVLLVAYAVMEWVEGPTLAELVRGVPASPETILVRLRYVVDVARAVTALHSRTRTGGNPSLHRDVKPTNCIAHPERGVVLLDLSTMRLVDDGFDPAGMCSPGYAAPEVLAAPHLPRRPSCDVYSVGALAAFCLLGEDPPIDLGGEAERGRLRERLLGLGHDVGVGRPELLADLVLESLEPDPAQRPGDVLAWAKRVQATAAPRTVPVPSPGRSSDAAGAGATGAGGVSADEPGAGGAPDSTEFPGPGTSPTAPRRSRRGTPVPPGRKERAPRRFRRPRRALVASVAALAVLSGTATAAALHWGGKDGAGTTAPAGTTTPSGSTSSGATVTGANPVPSSSTMTWQVGEAGALRGRIDAPADGTDVQHCAQFSGTSAVPTSATLLLAMRNLDNGDPTRYVTLVFAWDDPAQLARWEGAQYFGSNNDSVGQRYAVELIAVSNEVARAARATEDDDVLNGLAAQGVVLDSVRLTRIPGKVPGGCD